MYFNKPVLADVKMKYTPRIAAVPPAAPKQVPVPVLVPIPVPVPIQVPKPAVPKPIPKPVPKPAPKTFFYGPKAVIETVFKSIQADSTCIVLRGGSGVGKKTLVQYVCELQNKHLNIWTDDEIETKFQNIVTMKSIGQPVVNLFAHVEEWPTCNKFVKAVETLRKSATRFTPIIITITDKYHNMSKVVEKCGEAINLPPLPEMHAKKVIEIYAKSTGTAYTPRLFKHYKDGDIRSLMRMMDMGLEGHKDQERLEYTALCNVLMGKSKAVVGDEDDTSLILQAIWQNHADHPNMNAVSKTADLLSDFDIASYMDESRDVLVTSIKCVPPQTRKYWKYPKSEYRKNEEILQASMKSYTTRTFETRMNALERIYTLHQADVIQFKPEYLIENKKRRKRKTVDEVEEGLRKQHEIQERSIKQAFRFSNKKI